jgi:hypothetical protein
MHFFCGAVKARSNNRQGPFPWQLADPQHDRLSCCLLLHNELVSLPSHSKSGGSHNNSYHSSSGHRGKKVLVSTCSVCNLCQLPFLASWNITLGYRYYSEPLLLCLSSYKNIVSRHHLVWESPPLLSTSSALVSRRIPPGFNPLSLDHCACLCLCQQTAYLQILSHSTAWCSSTQQWFDRQAL